MSVRPISFMPTVLGTSAQITKAPTPVKNIYLKTWLQKCTKSLVEDQISIDLAKPN